MSQERMELRPETQKCSRIEKRRMASQNQQRSKIQMQHPTAQNFYQSNYNGMTLEQYFRSKQKGEEAVRGTPKSGQQKKQKFLVTSKEFFQQEMQHQQDLMRRTYMGERKYLNMRQDMSKRMQDYDTDLFQKYANKFDLVNHHNHHKEEQFSFKLK